MAQDIVSGLFGLAPYQVAQQQQREIDTDAAKFAQMNAAQRGTMGLYQGGAGLAGMAGGMLGIQNPAMVEAQQRQAALQGLDISSPESILARAQQIQDPKLKMQLMMLADQKKKEAQVLTAQAAKEKLDEARALQAEAMAAKLAFPTPEPAEKYQTPEQKLVNAYINAKEGSEEKKQLKRLLDERAYIKPAGASSGMTAGDLRQQKYEDSLYEKEKAKKDAAQSGLDAFDAIKRNIDDLYDPLNNRLKPNATALFGRADQFRPATLLSEGSANALSSLTALKDQITMSNLAEAKQRVGQSFGSMQVQEWDKFVRLISSLDRSMGEEKAASNLKFMLDFINKKSDILKTALNEPSRIGRKVGDNIPSPPTGPTTPASGAALPPPPPGFRR